MASQDEGLGGLAKRWLRNKVTELATTDRDTREQSGADAEYAAEELRNKAVGEAAMTAVPGLRRMKEQQEAAERRRDAEEQEALRALPQAGAGLSVQGVVTGTWSGLLRARVERDVSQPTDWDGDPAGPAEEWLRVELIALEEEGIPVVAGEPLFGWMFVVPGYTGPGTYDLRAMAAAREEGGGFPDPSDYGLYLGSSDEGFFWTPETGDASVEVDPGEASMTVRMTTSGPSGELAVVGRLNVAIPPATA